MPFKPNTCYSLRYEDGTGVTFMVNNVIPQALHLTMVKDCKTGMERRLFDLLIRPWTEIKRLECDQC